MDNEKIVESGIEAGAIIGSKLNNLEWRTDILKEAIESLAKTNRHSVNHLKRSINLLAIGSICGSLCLAYDDFRAARLQKELDAAKDDISELQKKMDEYMKTIEEKDLKINK